MSRFHGEQEDDVRKGRERAMKEQARHDREGAESEARYIARRDAGVMRTRPSGHWQFSEITNSRTGEVTGWQVDLNGRICGLLILKENDIAVISTATSDPTTDPNSPGPMDIMAAFIKLYPDPRVEDLRQMANRRRPQLPAENFGPPRDWSQDE